MQNPEYYNLGWVSMLVAVLGLIGTFRFSYTTKLPTAPIPEVVYASKHLEEDHFVLNRNDSYLLFDPDFFELDEADALMKELHDTLPWDWTYFELDGKMVRGPRQMAWFADGPTWNYSFSKNHVPGIPVSPWTPALLKARERLQEALGQDFNSVLANLYIDGSEHSAWHSDDDPWLGYPEPTDIPSLSFGYSRTFQWRPKDNKEDVSEVTLTHGSMVIMGGEFQKDFQHSVPPQDGEQVSYRINLTWRHIRYPERRPAKDYWHS